MPVLKKVHLLRELSGALGDLGTLLPLALGAIALGGLAPLPVLLGFGIAYIATALYYRLPIPVQPMKAVAAVLLTAQLTPAGIVATGVIIGLVLLLLGATGWITRLARIVPESVLAGLQLGLGVALALVSVELMAGAPLLAGVTLVLLLGIFLAPSWPGVVIALAVAVGMGQVVGTVGMAVPQGAAGLPALPGWADIEQALSVAVLPQLALTLMNAVVLTSLIARDYFGEQASHVTPARLSVTSGLGNLMLTPLGALPMCHGAGGLAAHHRFGARTGVAPLALGLALTAVALLPGGTGLHLLTLIPVSALGALLLVAAGELAFSKRLLDAKPSCWPVIAVTAGVTVWADPFWGLLAGLCGEPVRAAAVRLLRRDARS